MGASSTRFHLPRLLPYPQAMHSPRPAIQPPPARSHTMDELFDEIEHTLRSDGPSAALSRLHASLRQKKDYTGLFYALLMEKRHQLGVSPIPTGPARDIPESKQSAYEDAIRQAGRQVGELYLKEGSIPQVWPYYRIINE